MIAQFALRLIFGISLMWALMPRRDVTCGFFRIQMLLVLGLSVLSAITLGDYAILPAGGETLLSTRVLKILSVVLAVTAYAGSVLWTLDRRTGGTTCIAVILLISLVSLLATVSSASSLQSATGWLVLLSEISTAWILGAALTGMLLGHWYLTAPTMSIKPLSTLTLLFGGAVGLRLILSGVAWAMYASEITGSTHLTWFALRWVAGIAGSAAVFVMTWKILKFRNTQAATGVLFVGVILTFLGELSALLLYRGLKLPL
ncbi:MAG TPA: hypothetical protein VMM56_17295 [Planctomycetaceae bacterium]|nr:hypothetical protein [Planctomycetaceae bacterium]